MSLLNMENTKTTKKTLPPSDKYMLTIREAAEYFNIGTKRLRRLAEDNPVGIAVYCGNKYLINRPLFEDFLKNTSTI